MRKLLIKVGDVFGRLTVSSEPILQGKYRYVDVVCICGKMKNLPVSALTSGNTNSCGCLRLEIAATRCATMRKPRTYPAGSERSVGVWRQMLDRCNNPEHDCWHLYGGRGITVDPRWHIFAEFYADMGNSPKGWHIDRLDNEKGYSRDNCAWVPITASLKNRRITLWVTYLGMRMTLTELSAATGIPYDTLYRRYAKMRIDPARALDMTALTRPVAKRTKR